MSELQFSVGKSDIKAARLSVEQYDENFAEMHPPLVGKAALIEADRCYFCYDAPCTTACPTGIDIAGFIRMIAAGNNIGAAQLILEENIMGGTCARVCPTEVLCEEACVRNAQDHRPVEIGLLQRHAVDDAIDVNKQFFTRKPTTGKNVAIVGAGPAGLSCAHALAREGHQITIFEAKQKAGGLNEYGLAAYKMLNDFANKEIQYILEIGGINIEYENILGDNLTINQLIDSYDAAFLGVGLAGVNKLGLAGEDANGVIDAVNYIHQLRQANSMAELPVGRRVVVIGGGMTAIDIATQIKFLGAAEVTLVYRRGQEVMSASEKEQGFTKINGVSVRHNAQPHKLNIVDDHVISIEFENTLKNDEGKLVGSGSFFSLDADMVFKAIGQLFEYDDVGSAPDLVVEKGRVVVDKNFQTSLKGLWAGGDCIVGEDLTVSAIQAGKLAARSINECLNDED